MRYNGHGIEGVYRQIEQGDLEEISMEELNYNQEGIGSNIDAQIT